MIRFLWEKIGKDNIGKILLGILHETSDFVKMPAYSTRFSGSEAPIIAFFTWSLVG